MRDDESKRHIKEADTFIVSVGLNEIRDGKTAFEAFKSIEENLEDLTTHNKPISLLEIPPVANSVSQKNEAKCLNIMLKRLPTKHNNITVIETWNTLNQMEPHEIFEADGFHLDREKEGTTIVAQEILNHTKTALKETSKTVIITERINIQENTARHYIGINGKNLKKWTNEYEVQLSLPRHTDQIIVTGTKSNVENMIKEINRMKLSIAQSSQTEHHQRTRTTICKFYERGNCNRGNNCTYEHPISHRRSRSRSNVRNEIKRERRRSANRQHIRHESHTHENDTRLSRRETYQEGKREQQNNRRWDQSQYETRRNHYDDRREQERQSNHWAWE